MGKKILGLVFVFFCLTSLVFAEGIKPVQLALWSPIQLFPENDSIKGLRLNLLYTDNLNVSGLTLGAGWARTGGDMLGVSLGAVNWVDGLSFGFKGGILNYTGYRSVGLDIGVVNIGQGDTTGVQLGVVNWNVGFFHGWQCSLFNYVNGSFVGFQSGFVNMVNGNASGFQLGVANSVSGTMTGFQLGLVNTTNSLKGIQIGLIDRNGSGGPMVVTLLANWSF